MDDALNTKSRQYGCTPLTALTLSKVSAGAQADIELAGVVVADNDEGITLLALAPDQRRRRRSGRRPAAATSSELGSGTADAAVMLYLSPRYLTT